MRATTVLVVALACASLVVDARLGARSRANLSLEYLFAAGSGNVAADTSDFLKSAPLGSWPLELFAATWVVQGANLLFEPAGVVVDASCVASSSCASAPVISSGSVGSSVSSLVMDGGGFAIEAWIRPQSAFSQASFVDAASAGIAGAGSNMCEDTAEAGRSFALRQVGTAVEFYFVDQESVVSARVCVRCRTASGVLAPGVMTHVLGSVPSGTAGTVTLFVNGVAAACVDVPGSTSSIVGTRVSLAWATGANDRKLAVGGRRDGRYFWPGTVALVAFYSAPVSAVRAAGLAAAGPYNRPPVALPRVVTVLQNSGVTRIDLTGTDPDPGDTSLLCAHVVTAPSWGTLMLSSSGPVIGALPSVALCGNSSVFFVPPVNVIGTVSFAFVVSDGEANSTAAAIVTVEVAPVNQPPQLALAFAVATAPRGTTVALRGTASDADSSGSFELALWADRGALFLPSLSALQLAGLTVDAGAPSGSLGASAMIARGPMTAVNALLASLDYRAWAEGARASGSSTERVWARLTDSLGGTVLANATLSLSAWLGERLALASLPSTLRVGQSLASGRLELAALPPCGRAFVVQVVTVAGSGSGAGSGVGSVTISPTSVTISAQSGALSWPLTVSGVALGSVEFGVQVSGLGAARINTTSAVARLTVIASGAMSVVGAPVALTVGEPSAPLQLVLSTAPLAGPVSVSLAAPDVVFSPSVLTVAVGATSAARTFTVEASAAGAVTATASVAGAGAAEFGNGLVLIGLASGPSAPPSSAGPPSPPPASFGAVSTATRTTSSSTVLSEPVLWLIVALAALLGCLCCLLLVLAAARYGPDHWRHRGSRSPDCSESELGLGSVCDGHDGGSVNDYRESLDAAQASASVSASSSASPSVSKSKSKSASASASASASTTHKRSFAPDATRNDDASNDEAPIVLEDARARALSVADLSEMPEVSTGWSRWFSRKWWRTVARKGTARPVGLELGVHGGSAPSSQLDSSADQPSTDPVPVGPPSVESPDTSRLSSWSGESPWARPRDEPTSERAGEQSKDARRRDAVSSKVARAMLNDMRTHRSTRHAYSATRQLPAASLVTFDTLACSGSSSNA